MKIIMLLIILSGCSTNKEKKYVTHEFEDEDLETLIEEIDKPTRRKK